MRTARGVTDAVAVVDRVLDLVAADASPRLEALAVYLQLEIHARSGATLELLGRHLRIDAGLPRVPQLACGLARYLIRCGYACDECALKLALIERCERPPVTAAQHARIYGLFSVGDACA